MNSKATYQFKKKYALVASYRNKTKARGPNCLVCSVGSLAKNGLYLLEGSKRQKQTRNTITETLCDLQSLKYLPLQEVC